MTAFYIVVFVLLFGMFMIGYALGKGRKPKTVGAILAVEDPVDHQIYLSASFKRREDVEDLHNGDVVSFVVQR